MRMAAQTPRLPRQSHFSRRTTNAKTIVGSGTVGLEPDRLTELADCLRRLPLFCREHGEIEVGIGIVRVLSWIAARELGERFSRLPCIHQGVAEVVWASAMSGLSRIASRNSVIASGFVLPVQGPAEAVMSVGVIGLEPDRLTVRGDRLAQLARSSRAFPRLLWASASWA